MTRFTSYYIYIIVICYNFRYNRYRNIWNKIMDQMMRKMRRPCTSYSLQHLDFVTHLTFSLLGAISRVASHVRVYKNILINNQMPRRTDFQIRAE